MADIGAPAVLQGLDMPPSRLEVSLSYRHAYGFLAPYFAGLLQGRAIAARCPACGRTWFPPRRLCLCGRRETVWWELPGTGTVSSVSTGVSRLPLSSRKAVVIVALVALDGADNMTFGRLAGVPEDVRAGMRVRLRAQGPAAPHPAQQAVFVPV